MCCQLHLPSTFLSSYKVHSQHHPVISISISISIIIIIIIIIISSQHHKNAWVHAHYWCEPDFYKTDLQSPLHQHEHRYKCTNIEILKGHDNNFYNFLNRGCLSRARRVGRSWKATAVNREASQVAASLSLAVKSERRLNTVVDQRSRQRGG